MSTSISVKGKIIEVPAIPVDGANVVVTGKWLKIARIHDEEWMNQNMLPEPLALLEKLKNAPIKADLFTFAQKVSDPKPRFPFWIEWDNAAIITIKTYKDWWDQLPQVARRNVRIAEKKGIVFRVVPFDDELVKGIVSVYNEAPVRLGKPFWHYGKSEETVKRENGTFVDRSDFIGAFLDGKLIGFIKLVYVDRVGSMMQILSMIQHQDKRTTNGLIAKAVEVCAEKGMSHLMYCKYVYGVNEDSLLTDFKRRNGFERLEFPQYYVPLTQKGRIALALRAHHGIKGLLPKPIFSLALHVRTQYYNFRQRRSSATAD